MTKKDVRREVRAWQRARRRGYRYRVITPRIVLKDFADRFLRKTALYIAVWQPDRLYFSRQAIDDIQAWCGPVEKIRIVE